MGSYSLVTSYVGESILSGFDFFSASDPSNGFVAYQSQANASQLSLYSVNELTQALTISVDTNTTLAANGSEGYRPSIRLESQATFNHGLLIGDFEHMPGSVCGSWPAFWVYGPNWPEGGEIDIIEGANTAQRNLMSGHTVMPTNGSDCTLPTTGFTGSVNNGHTDCTSPGNNSDVGCNFVPPVSDTDSYGDSFNAVSGGVYAMEWTSAFIKIWHWDRNSIPIDIIAENPDPSNWGEPEALFGGSTCDIDTFFYDMRVVLNMDLCGAYAGNVWGVTDDCTELAPTCNEWVAEHPEALIDVYWEVNSIAIYQTNTAAASSTTGAAASSNSAMPLASSSAIVASMTGSATSPSPALSSVTSNSSGVSASSSFTSPSTSGASSGSSSVSLPDLSLSTSSTTATSTTALSVSSVSNASAGSSPTTASDSTADSSVSSTISDTVPAKSTSTNSSPAHDPTSVDGYSFLGCFTSQSGFKAFDLQGVEPENTVELCVRVCRVIAGRPYVGILNQACYCAKSLDPGTTALSQTNPCNIPCPGNSMEFCGGRTGNGGNGNSVKPRQALSDTDLLTVYGDVAAIQPVVPPAPAMGANSSSSPASTEVVTLTTTVTYTTVCATNPASLVVTEYCATLTATRCGCASETTPVVPCATVTQACDSCGPQGDSVVTLTVPAALVTPTGTANTSATGLAVVQVGGGAAVGFGFWTGTGAWTGGLEGVLLASLGFWAALLLWVG